MPQYVIFKLLSDRKERERKRRGSRNTLKVKYLFESQSLSRVLCPQGHLPLGNAILYTYIPYSRIVSGTRTATARKGVF